MDQSPSPESGTTQPAGPLFQMALLELVSPPRTWKLEAFPGHLALFAPGETQPFIYPRVNLAKEMELTPLPQALVVISPRKIIFRFQSPAEFARLRAWLGPALEQHLLAALKRRYSWVFPIAALFVLTSLPMSGNPSAGLKPIPFDAFGFGLGVSLVAMGLLSRWRPHRIFFLLDSIWFAALAGSLVWRVLHGDSVWWLVAVLMQCWLIHTGIEQYRYYAGTRVPTTGAG